MSLSDLEVRMLGSLLEKEMTTPETYPLSINALVLACNQKTNRDPVTDYTQREVEDALQSLRNKGLVRSSQASNERVVKHQHRLDEAFALGKAEFAVLAVLLLRGAQTPGELRSRTERYVSFSSLGAVEESLRRLQDHSPPLARNYGRGPSQSQDRWNHTLGFDPERMKPRARVPEPVMPEPGMSEPVMPDRRGGSTDDIDMLRHEVTRLQRQVARLMQHVGLTPEDEDTGA